MAKSYEYDCLLRERGGQTIAIDERLKGVRKLLVVELSKFKDVLNGVGQSLLRDDLGQLIQLDETPGALSLANLCIVPKECALLRVVYDSDNPSEREMKADLMGVVINGGTINNGGGATEGQIIRILCDKACTHNMTAKSNVATMLKEMNQKIPVYERPDLFFDLRR